MKKVCFLTPRFSYPENGGDVVLLNDLMHWFKDQGYEVIQITFYEKEQEKLLNRQHDYIDKLFPIKRDNFVSIKNTIMFYLKGLPLQCGYYYSKKMLNSLKQIIQNEQPDIYVCHLLRMIPYFDALNIKDNVIVQMSDVLSKTYGLASKSAGSPLKKLIYKFETKRMELYERTVVRNYRKVVLVSKNDKDYFGLNKNVFYHNNGIRNIIHYDSVDENKIVYIGNMRTLQNLDGCLYFIREIFPLIQKQKPNVQLHVVGFAPEKIINKLNYKNVLVTGYVESIEDYIKDAVVSVAPIRVASGIQNKVLISMACNVPVVLSSLISKGIPELKHGENCFIQDEPQKFASCCLELINNQKERNLITSNATKIIEENYIWNIHLKGYDKFTN